MDRAVRRGCTLAVGGTAVAAFAVFGLPRFVAWVEAEADEIHECESNPTADPLNLQSTLSSGLYLAGCVWIFLGLAMVCEEYFVLALQVLIDTLQVPPDVAGATFMAAGSSSPEVFAALFGIFEGSDKESDEAAGGAGLATVAGSCVFNVLIIVGASVLIGGSITMDWRPSAREIAFYTLSIAAMLVVFADGLCTPVEAWGMVGVYVASVGGPEMLLRRMSGQPAPAPLHKQLTGAEVNAQQILSGVVKQKQLLLMHERHKVVEILFVVIEEAFTEFDTDGSGSLELTELRAMLQALDVVVKEEEVGMLFRVLDADGDGTVTLGEFVPTFWIWKQCESLGVSSVELDEATEQEIRQKFSEMDANEDGLLDGDELLKGIRAMTQNTRSELQLLTLLDKAGIDVKVGMPLGEFKRLYLLWSGKEVSKVVHEVHSPFHWPSHAPLGGKFLFILGWPFSFSFYLTIPSPHAHKHAFWLSMLASIAWLGLLVFLMISWAEKAGCLLRISPTFMGLTFCAAGTSAPDAIASILVAKAGQGDMAVSNAFGSNIFDILMGMGLPFVIKTLVEGGSFAVATDGLEDSAVVLIGLLVLYVAMLYISRMQVTRTAGWIFLCLYGCYVAKCILEEMYRNAPPPGAADRS